jgi:4-amino-4-deoxy-L-arabinose transferase-like glycosyltransferase
MWPAVAVAGGLWLVCVGQLQFARGSGGPLTLALWLAGVAATTVAIRADNAPEPVAVALESPGARHWWPTPLRLAAVVVGVAAVVIVCNQEWRRAPDVPRWDLLAMWCCALVATLLATCMPAELGLRSFPRWASSRRTTLWWTAAFGLGALPLTLVRLGSHPWLMNGDEGGFALVSEAMLDGRVRDPFGTGFWSHPLLYNAAQAAAMGAAGRTVFAARLVSALIGAATVPLLYLFTQRLIGRRRPAVMAALLLATFHVHLYWSRSVLPNVASETFVVLVLYLLDRTLTTSTPGNAFGLGAATGLAQYGYFSNRILVPVVVVALLVAAVPVAARRRWVDGLRWLATRLGLVAAGFAVAVAPLATFYARHPAEFDSRVRIVSLLHASALRDEATRTGHSQLHVVVDHLLAATLLPFRTAPAGFYRGAVPFVGWAIAVPAAVGVVVALTRLRSPRWIGVSAAYWVTAIGLALTIGPAETNRWVMAIPLVCLFAAVGLDGATRAVVGAWPASRHAAEALAAGVVLAGSCWSLVYFFSDSNRGDVYGDVNTEVAEHLAREVEAIGPGATVYFLGAPRMTYRGFGDLVFRTPDATAVDVTEPWAPTSAAPSADTTTLFVAVPERAGELDLVTLWYPDGVRHDTRDDRGAVLYTSVLVRPP